MAERARARTLAEARHVTGRASLSDVQAALQPDEAVIALNQFDDELAVWVIRAMGIDGVAASDDAAYAATFGRAAAGRDLATAPPRPAPAASCINEMVRPVAAQLARRVSTGVGARPDVSERVVRGALGRLADRTLPDRGVAAGSRRARASIAYVAGAAARAAPTGAQSTDFGRPYDRADSEARAVGCSTPPSAVLNRSRQRRAARLSRPSASHMRRPLSRPHRREPDPTRCCRRLMVADEPGARHSGADPRQRHRARHDCRRPNWSSSTRSRRLHASRRGHVEPGPRVHGRRRAGRASERCRAPTKRHSRSDDQLPPRDVEEASPQSRPSTQSNATQYSRTAVDSALGLRWCFTAPIDSPPT